MSAELPLSVGDRESSHTHAHSRHLPALAASDGAFSTSLFAWSAVQRLGFVAVLIAALWAAVAWAMA